MRFTTTAVLITLFVLAALPGALAQADKFTGTWQCQLANQTVSNNRFENYIYNFTMRLDAGGGFRAQGTYFAETNGYADPFQAQGQWKEGEGGIVGEGQAYKQSGNVPFAFQFTYYNPRSMSYRMTSPYGRMAMACQR